MNFVDLLVRIAEQPLIYVGKASIERIDAFICGYAVCAFDHHVQIDGWDDYSEFLERKYTGGERVRWSTILRVNSKDEEGAFQLFVETLNEFVNEARDAR